MNKALKRHGKKSYSHSYDYRVTDPASIFYGWRKSHVPKGEWFDIQVVDDYRFALDSHGDYRGLV